MFISALTMRHWYITYTRLTGSDALPTQYWNYCDHLLTDEWLMISYSSTDTQLTIAGTGPALAWHSNDKSIDILTNTRLMRWSTPPIKNKIYRAYIVVSLSIVEDNNKGKFHVK